MKHKGDIEISRNVTTGGFIDLPAIQSPDNPGTDVLRVFNKSGEAAIFQQDSTGSQTNITSPVSAGGGGTGRNFIVNSNFESDASQWSDTGTSLTLSRTTASSEILSDTGSLKIAFTNTTSGDLVTGNMNTLDRAFKNRQNSVQFDFHVSGAAADSFEVVMYDNTNSGEIPLNPNISLPAQQGLFQSNWTATDSDDYELRIKSVTNGESGCIFIDNVVVGPNEIVYGASISDYVNDGASTLTSTNTDVSKGTIVNDVIHTKREGDLLKVFWTYEHSTAGAGTGTYLLKIPNDLTIDSSKIVVSTDPTTGHCGEGVLDGSSQTIVMIATTYDENHIQFRQIPDGTGGGATWGSAGHGPLTQSSIKITVNFQVPIVGWSSNTILSNSRVEYAHNFDTNDTNDTTSFAYGEAGSLIPSASSKTKRVRFSRTFKHYSLEVQISGTGPFIPVEYTKFGRMRRGSSDSGKEGMGFEYISGNDFDVHFSQNGTSDTIIDGSNLYTSWSTENSNGTRWRMVASDNPLSVETALKEYKTTISAETAVSSGGNWPIMTGNSVPLTPGEWMIFATGFVTNADTTTVTLKISNENGDGTSSEPANHPNVQISSINSTIDFGSGAGRGTVQNITRLKASSNTTIYAVMTASSGSSSVTSRIYAERIS